MGNDIEMNEKNEKKDKIKAIVFLSILILSWFFWIVCLLSDFKGSRPLMWLLFMIGCATLFLFPFIPDSGESWFEHFRSFLKSVKKNPRKFIYLLFAGLFVIGFVAVAQKSIYDLVKGPQEIVLYDIDTVYKRTHSYKGSGGPEYHLLGTTEDGTTLKIVIDDDVYDEINALKKEIAPNTITISYYKGYKELYEIVYKPQEIVLKTFRTFKSVGGNDETKYYLGGRTEDDDWFQIPIPYDDYEEITAKIKNETKWNDTIIAHYCLGPDGFCEIEVVK